jgi:hypothetical protein
VSHKDWLEHLETIKLKILFVVVGLRARYDPYPSRVRY